MIEFTLTLLKVILDPKSTQTPTDADTNMTFHPDPGATAVTADRFFFFVKPVPNPPVASQSRKILLHVKKGGGEKQSGHKIPTQRRRHLAPPWRRRRQRTRRGWSPPDHPCTWKRRLWRRSRRRRREGTRRYCGPWTWPAPSPGRARPSPAPTSPGSSYPTSASRTTRPRCGSSWARPWHPASSPRSTSSRS
jgi:hypothetical protein